MLYNYGAAILRAIGDTKRPLIFLIISGIANAALNMILVILFHMGVVGVAIGTIISQLISCVLVLTCLYRSEGSYQLRFSKLKINGATWNRFPGGSSGGNPEYGHQFVQCTVAVLG